MKNEDAKIIGSTICDIKINGDSLEMIFNAGKSLSIFNSWTLQLRNSNITTVDQVEVLNLIGQAVSTFETFTDSIEIGFDSNLFFSIGLKDESWNGPEAAVLYEGDVPVIVWN